MNQTNKRPLAERLSYGSSTDARCPRFLTLQPGVSFPFIGEIVGQRGRFHDDCEALRARWAREDGAPLRAYDLVQAAIQEDDEEEGAQLLYQLLVAPFDTPFLPDTL